MTTLTEATPADMERAIEKDYRLMTARRAGRTDGNQQSIVESARKLGATVQVLSGMGEGCPDLLIGFRGRNYLVEVKDPAQPPSARRLTPDQTRWHAEWLGQVAIVEDYDDLKDVLGVGTYYR